MVGKRRFTVYSCLLHSLLENCIDTIEAYFRTKSIVLRIKYFFNSVLIQFTITESSMNAMTLCNYNFILGFATYGYFKYATIYYRLFLIKNIIGWFRSVPNVPHKTRHILFRCGCTI